MTAEQLIMRTQAFCKQTAVRENLRIRLARMLGTPQEADLRSQLSFADSQLRRLREEPGYELVPDPMEQNPSHRHCETELEKLRIENMRLRVKQDTLWEMNADMKFELGKLRPTKHALPGATIKRGPGRPRSADTTAKRQGAGRLMERVGVAGVDFNVMTGVLSVSRPALDKLLAMLEEHDELSQRAVTEEFVEEKKSA